MRRILIAIILFTTAFFPGIQIDEFAPIENVIAERAVEDFTHVVIGEEFTATWCVYCPSAAENLMKIYEEVPNEPYYDDQFFFVALITDMVDKADDRTDDYPGFQGYPTVYFDGGDEEVVGGQSSTSNYENAIDSSGGRTDTDISLTISMQHVEDDTITVQAAITWNEDGTTLNPTFDGFIRAYITEPISRYDNYDGDPYHFGFLDYAFEESVDLEPHEELVLTTTWIGGEHQDANGNDFSDIDYDNLVIFASLFDDETSTTDEYALQTAAAIPPEIDVDNVDGVVSGNVDISGYSSVERASLTQLEYSIDDGEWTDITDSLDDEAFSFEWDSGSVGGGYHDMNVRATNEYGTTNVGTITVEVDNDETPPEVEIISPENGVIANDYLDLIVEASDDVGIQGVDYSISGPFVAEWHSLEYNEDDDNYQVTIDTLNHPNGVRTLQVRAYDSSNVVYDDIEIDLRNEENDVIPPEIDWTPPDTDGAVSGVVEITMEVEDNYGISYVQYMVNSGEWNTMEQIDESSTYSSTWDSNDVCNGVAKFTVQAYDNQDNYDEIEEWIDVENGNSNSTACLDIISPGENEHLAGIMSIEVVALDEEGINNMDYKIDGNAWINMESDNGLLYQAEVDITLLDDGYHTLTVKAITGADEPTTQSIDFFVDNTGPVASITQDYTVAGYLVGFDITEMSDDTGVGGNYSYRISTAENGSMLSMYQEVINNRIEMDISYLTAGNHEIEIMAYDTLGNMQITTKSFVVDHSEMVEITPLDFEDWATLEFEIWAMIETAYRMDAVLLQIYNQDMIFLTVPLWFVDEDSGSDPGGHDGRDTYTTQIAIDEPGTYTLKIKMETGHADLVGIGGEILIRDPNELTEVTIPNQVEAGVDFVASIIIEQELQPLDVKIWVENYDIELDQNENIYSTLLRLPSTGNYNLHFEITIPPGSCSPNNCNDRTFESENYQITVIEPQVEEETEEEDGMFVFETPSLGIIPIIVALLVMSFITKKKD